VWVRKRIDKKRSFLKKHRMLMLILVATCGSLSTFILMQKMREPEEIQEVATDTRPPVLESKPQSQPAKEQRFIYPYSVIRGGVLSREELVHSTSNDPVVAKHYARFAMDQARIVKAEKTQLMHVSYRIRDKVYWTAKQLKIAEGEPLITDGRDLARTRCGNRVSIVPMEPVSEEEPPIEAFDHTILVESIEPDLPLLLQSSLEIHNIPVMDPVPDPYHYRSRPASPPDLVLPEPATLSLLASAFAALLTFRFVRKK
jgi:hypothetical protein